ncbi:MAG TPA: 3-phosphoshikimate 1-carboxyvinyltransferase [Bacteroidia bacterium]|jgi:3-phosphoshikimate 1-carboxyvinyltransferase|nr:3-phosphoshikimate 1-carboxyvinyltransferase [Bacteroidia bacterium]
MKLNIPRKLKGEVKLPLSKSECNRLLIIRAITGTDYFIPEISDAEDTVSLGRIISELKEHKDGNTYDVGAAGTTMRFLSAYLSSIPGVFNLTGTARMQERPIGILVKALESLGADIEYGGKEGFPPLKIFGGPLKGGEIEVDGSVSSQFISALLMIAPTMHNGLVIHFKGNIVSRPYIDMTIRIMERFHVYPVWDGNTLAVSNQHYTIDDPESQFEVEPDWSAASYWYSMVALADEADIFLPGLKKDSLQADAVCSLLFPFFGVTTTFEEKGIRLTKNGYRPNAFAFDFEDSPDIVQTVAVTAAALKIPTLLCGLNTLRVKETDRVKALKIELAKLGVHCEEPGRGMLEIKTFDGKVQSPLKIATYEDHRMAMSFAPLGIKFPGIEIEDPHVVKKSYPGFWEEVGKITNG